MELRLLGTSGARVSPLCLGTMIFGSSIDEQASVALVHQFLDAGGNFLDTADSYNGGLVESIVGRALAGRRDSVVLATKGRMPVGDDDDQGASRRYLTRAVEASLARLGTDRIDLYQIHWPDPTVPLEETLSTLDDLVRAGKIRSIGLSNYLGWELQKAFGLCAQHGWTPVVSHQPQYSLIHREIELDSLPLCASNDVAVLPWSPLGGGLLSGKYRGDVEPGNDTRLGSDPLFRHELTERNLAVAEAVKAVAAKTGHSAAQVALNWVMHRPGVTSPIVGARTPAQLADNLEAATWRLEPEHVTVLTKASRYPLTYPHDLYRWFGFRRYD